MNGSRLGAGLSAVRESREPLQTEALGKNNALGNSRSRLFNTRVLAGIALLGSCRIFVPRAKAAPLQTPPDERLCWTGVKTRR
jgi:hypothetical protein